MIERRAMSLSVSCLVLGMSALASAQQPKPQAVAPLPAAASPVASGGKPLFVPAAVPAPVVAPTPAGSDAPAAFAAKAKQAKAAVAPSPSGGTAAASAPEIVAPKPAPELDQMKVLEGKWRCEGRAPAGPTGPEHAYKSTWKFKRDLDNFWWAAEYQQSKAKAHPLPMKARGYMTFDPNTRTFVLVGVDNMGGSSTESTSGWTGDVVTLAGDASMSGRKVPYREVITKKGDREFTWRGEMKMDGDWVTLGEDRCKKRSLSE